MRAEVEGYGVVRAVHCEPDRGRWKQPQQLWWAQCFSRVNAEESDVFSSGGAERIGRVVRSGAVCFLCICFL